MDRITEDQTKFTKYTGKRGRPKTFSKGPSWLSGSSPSGETELGNSDDQFSIPGDLEGARLKKWLLEQRNDLSKQLRKSGGGDQASLRTLEIIDNHLQSMGNNIEPLKGYTIGQGTVGFSRSAEDQSEFEE